MIHKDWDINEHNTGKIHNGKPVKGVTFQNGLNDIEPDGSFVPCDMNIEAANIGVTTHKIKRGRYGQLRLGDTTTNKPLIKIKDKDMKGISLQYVNGGNGSVIVGDKKASFPEVDGVGIEITPYYKGVKVELIISDPQTAPLEYPFSLKDYGQNYSYEIVNGAIIGTGEDGKKVTLHAPYAIDANGETGQVDYVMTGVVNNLQTFKKVVDEAWLRSRVGAVSIDPDVTIEDGIDGGIVKDTRLRAAIPDFNEGGNIYVTMRLNIYRALFKSSFPNLGTISVISSHWKLFNAGIYSVTAYSHRVLRDWVEMEATWNSWKTGESWTIAGGQDIGTDIGEQLASQVIYAGANELDVDATVTQDFYDNPSTNFGIILKGTGLEASFHSSENATNVPQFYMEYTEGGAQILRRRMEGY